MFGEETRVSQTGILPNVRWILSLGLVLSLPCVAGARESPPSLAEVLEGMRRLEERVRSLPSWRVVYRQTRDIPKDIPHGFITEMPPREYVFARRGDLDFAYVHKSPVPNEHEEWFVWRDGVGVDRFGTSIMIRAESNVGLWDTAYYPKTLFLNIRTKREYPDPNLRSEGDRCPYDAMMFALPGSVEKRREKYRVRPKLETVDGIPCVVVEEPGVDVIWVAAKHGYVCLRRQVFQSTGDLLVEWRNQDLREWAPGLWLPARQTVDAYNDQTVTPPEVRGKRRITLVNAVREMSFAELPASFFTVPLSRTGETTVHDYIRGKEYTVLPGSMTPEQLVDEALLSAGLSRLPRRDVSARTLFFMVNGIVLGALLLVYQVRRMRRAGPFGT